MDHITATRLARCDAFIAAADAEHGGRYDYSLLPDEFVNVKDGADHLPGARCLPDGAAGPQGENGEGPSDSWAGLPRLLHASRTAARRLQLFLDRALEVHGSRYDYRNVDFVDQRTSIRIRCFEHGAFSVIMPKNHLAVSSVEGVGPGREQSPSARSTTPASSVNLAASLRQEARRYRATEREEASGARGSSVVGRCLSFPVPGLERLDPLALTVASSLRSRFVHPNSSADAAGSEAAAPAELRSGRARRRCRMPNADNDPRRRARHVAPSAHVARIPLADLRDQSPPNLQALYAELQDDQSLIPA